MAPRTNHAHREGTRERILTVAVELFARQGYGGTSLRQIAERLDITKAAISYHFHTKEEIARAVLDRTLDVFAQISDRLAVAGSDAAAWERALDQIIELALGERDLLHAWERNEDAFQALFHDDPEIGGRIAAAGTELIGGIGDERVDAARRVRLGCAFGAVWTPLTMLSPYYGDLPQDELRRHIRDAVAALLNRSP